MVAHGLRHQKVNDVFAEDAGGPQRPAQALAVAGRIAELERRFSGVMRHGTVEEVDAGKQRLRLNFGKAAVFARSTAQGEKDADR